MDTVSRDKRSWIMSRIRSKWTNPEKKAHGILKSRHVRHRMHPGTYGNPDAEVGDIVLFVDGCFWHGCPKHLKLPKTNRKFWRDKIRTNVARDRRITRELRAKGVKVARIFECKLNAETLIAAVGGLK